MYVNVPTMVKNSAPPPIETPSSRTFPRQPGTHRDRGGKRQHGEGTDGDTPADERAREADAEPPDEPPRDECRHVVPHRPRSDPRHERLDDVRSTHGQEARHAEALEGAADEERLEPGRKRNPDRGRHEQQAGKANRPRSPDPV
jgi:hypothetical protein